MHSTYSHVTHTSGWMGALWHTPYYGSLGNLSWSCHDRLAHLVACGENDANLRQEGTTDGRQSYTQASVSQSYISKEYSSLRHRKTFSTIILLVFGLKSCF